MNSLEHGDKSFCIPSIKRLIPVPEVTATANFDFSQALESVYPLLDIILSYLDYNDLRTCCDVKKSWKEVAENILKKRMQPSWFTCFKSNSNNVFERSDNLNYNNVGFGIILYDFRRIKLNKYICVHTDWKELSRKSVPEYFEDELVPYKTDYCVISCPKVISFFDDASKNICQASYFDGLFFPKIPNIRMTMFHCNPVRKENIQSTLEAYINVNEEIKCLLMFSMTDQKKSLLKLLKSLIPEDDPESVAVGGGIIRGTKTFQQIHSTKRVYSNYDIFSIAFLKEKNVEANFNAFSYVIYGDDLSKDEFAIEVCKFKENVLLRTHAVAFRICCSGKIDADEEPLIFNKIFPGIPILGFHADGEIGWNCLLSSKKIEETLHKQILEASEKGNLDVVKSLLQSHPELINIVDKDGYTPLHRACYSNNVNIVEYLVENGANIAAQTEMMWQPLHSCCQWNHKECAAILIQHGADINAQSEGGQTPLHIAASHGISYDTVQLLLMHPLIDPTIMNNSGETARDIAVRNSRYYNVFEMADPNLDIKSIENL